MTYIFPKGPKPTLTFKVLPRIDLDTPQQPLTANELLELIKTVDGHSSGLDADLLDGQHASFFASASALAAEITARQQSDVPAGGDPGQVLTKVDGADYNYVWADPTGGGGGGSTPIFLPEDYGAVSNGDPAATVTAFNDMFAAMTAVGGGIAWLRGRYLIDAPLVIPDTVPIALLGIARAKNLNGDGCIVSTAGDHDIIRFPYGAGSIYVGNLNIGVLDSVVPTSGWTVDARWLSEAKFENVLLYNNCCGIDLGVSRASILDGVYIIGLAGTSAQIGSDQYGRDLAFGIMVRSTQTLLEGNAGFENSRYDHDGPGVLVQPKSKGTNLRMRNVRVSGKLLSDPDDEEGGITEEYNPDAVGFDFIGASTVRMDVCQAHSVRHAIRVRHAPNLGHTNPPDNNNRLGPETGKQMVSGLVITNFTSEACLQTYKFGGYEKLYCSMLQANGCATYGYEIGDNPSDSYPGIPPGTAPVDFKGGAGTFVACNALTCREQGFRVYSGCNRLIEPQVASFAGNRPGDTDPGSEAQFDATTTSQRIPYPSGNVGDTYTFRSDALAGGASIWFRSGNSSVVATTAGPSTEVKPKSGPDPGFVNFVRGAGETHVAFIVAAGTEPGELGKPATLLSEGILINDTAVNGTWINGGIVSADKSLGQVDPGELDDIGPALKIENGADKVYVDGLDIAEGTIVNDANNKQFVQIQNLKRNIYRYDPFRALPVNNVAGTAYTFGLKDLDGLVRSTSASATVFTIPTNATVPLPIGAEILGGRGGTGTLQIVAAGGVTIRNEGSAPYMLANQHQMFRIVQHAANEWTLVIGDGSLRAAMDASGVSGQVWKRTGSGVGQYGWGTDDVSGGGGSGEANTISSVGVTGVSLVAGKVGVDLQVKGLDTSGLASRTFNSTDVTIAVNSASQAEAEAGTAGNRAMTPERTSQHLAVRLAPTVHAYATKAPPASGDELLLLDAAAAFVGKRLLWDDLLTALNATLSVATVANNAITDAKLRDSVALSVIGRATNTTGDPADIAAGTDGHVLRRAGTALGFGQLALGAFPDGLLTYAKLQDVSANDRLLGRATTGAGDIEEIVCTAQARALLDDTSFAAMLSTLGAAAASHTHPASQVTDFSEAVDDRVAALLVAGANVTLTYNDAANTLTIDATGGGGGGGDITGGSSLGAGAAVFESELSGVLRFRSLIGTAPIVATQNTNDITLSLADAGVTDAKLRDSTALSVIGRASDTAGVPADIAAASDGLVLRRSGTALGFGQLAIGAFANDVITYAKLQNVSATDRLLGRSTAGAGDIEEITCTAAGRALLDDANAAAQITTLGAVPATRLVAAGGLATGGGDLTADRTITVTAASQAQAEAGTDTATVITPQRWTQAFNKLFGTLINGFAAKTTPIGADLVGIYDTADTTAPKKVTLTNLFGQFMTIGSALLADAAALWAATADRIVTAASLTAAHAIITVTPSGTTYTPSQNSGTNFSLGTLAGGANTLALMTNLKNGRGGVIELVTGSSSTLAVTAYDTPDAGATITLPTASGKTVLLGYMTNAGATAVRLWKIGEDFA